MRRNIEQKDMQVYCNCCGRQLITINGIVKEGVAPVKVEWGYFSTKDGDTHKFDLCEECYSRIVCEFKIPVEIVPRNEML